MLTEMHSYWPLLWSWPVCYSFQSKFGFLNSSHYLVWSISLSSVLLQKKPVFIHSSTPAVWTIPPHLHNANKVTETWLYMDLFPFWLPTVCFCTGTWDGPAGTQLKGSLIKLPVKYYHSAPCPSTSLWALVSISWWTKVKAFLPYIRKNSCNLLESNNPQDRQCSLPLTLTVIKGTLENMGLSFQQMTWKDNSKRYWHPYSLIKAFQTAVQS